MRSTPLRISRPVLIHSGQHYDVNMSDAFFRDSRLPAPDHHLGIGSGSHAEQTGGVMIAYEKIALAERPDWWSSSATSTRPPPARSSRPSSDPARPPRSGPEKP
jgi:hypothetical protein